MKQIIRKGVYNLLGFANYHRLVEVKNSVLNNSENKKREASLAAMIHLYSSFVKEGDLCFDVGANMGNRIEAFLKIAPGN